MFLFNSYNAEKLNKMNNLFDWFALLGISWSIKLKPFDIYIKENIHW
jgi:hypothetical protein